MDIFYRAVYAILFLAIELEYVTMCLRYVQLSGYTYSSVWGHLCRGIKRDYALIILYLLFSISLVVIRCENIYFLIALLFIFGFLIVFLGDRFCALKKLNYTKRMTRILVVVSVVLLSIAVIVYMYFSNLILLIAMPMFLAINYLVIAISLLILSPLEKAINKSYTKKVKLKLGSMKNLIKIGITGSFGKTSTKEILLAILSTTFYTLATPKSYNTPMGISRAVLENLEPLHEVFVCEMGAKKVGEIKELCDLVNVDYGIVTAVGRQHTNTFGSLQNIYRAKKELPDYLSHKSCVFNLTNKYVNQMYHEYSGSKIGVFCIASRKIVCNEVCVKNYCLKIKKATIVDNEFVLYDNLKKNNVYAKKINLSENGSTFDVYFDNEKICTATSRLIGMHNIVNILLSVAMAKMLGVGSDNIKIGIENVGQIKARLERFVGQNGAVILNNGYNSNIDSLDASLNAVKLFKKPNILVVTPGVIDSKNKFETNKIFGRKISKVATEVIIVKRLNKDAIYLGLTSSGFDKTKIYFADKFGDVKSVINALGEDYVVLIENDLPDNFL